MFAVIFKAEVAGLDEEYQTMAEHMRNLAIEKYGCLEFSSATEGDREIAVSYWETEDQIKEWKNDSEHLLAQEQGRNKWYESYRVQIVEILREYGG